MKNETVFEMRQKGKEELEGSSAEARGWASAYHAVDAGVCGVDRSLRFDQELGVLAAFSCFDFDDEVHDGIYALGAVQ